MLSDDQAATEAAGEGSAREEDAKRERGEEGGDEEHLQDLEIDLATFQMCMKVGCRAQSPCPSTLSPNRNITCHFAVRAMDMLKCNKPYILRCPLTPYSLQTTPSLQSPHPAP